MTIPSERTRAIQGTEQFLLDLLSPTATPRVPPEIRQRALRCLRHYPGRYELTRMAKVIPESWGVPE